jgi:hypothetical protein
MYFVSAVLLVAILPAASVILEAALATHGLSIMALVGKWYVFWACGVRLVLAGLRQVSQPCFTAAEIFNLDNVKAFPMVREIGFGLHDLPAGMADSGGDRRRPLLWARGIGHVPRIDQNVKETVAMISDGFAFLALLAVAFHGWL